jgi:hypothetical protein
MTDVFNVTATYDKPAGYNAGDTITITISGGDVLTSTTTTTIGPVTIPIVAADGAKSTVSVPAVKATTTTTTPESVLIDTSTPIVDTGTPVRVWTVSTNKLSITSIA